MLLLKSTDIIRIVTGAAADIDAYVSYIDLNGSTTTPDRQVTPAIVTATTTTICSSPAASTTRNVKYLNITNNSISVSTTVDVEFFDGTNPTELRSVTLLPGENLALDDVGEWHHLDNQNGEYTYAGNKNDAYSKGYGITGTVAETMCRSIAGVNVAALTSGSLWFQAVYLYAGDTATNIVFFSGTTASGTPTNGFFALYDINRNKLAETANFTTEAWAVNSAKSKALITPYKVPTTGIYYVAIMITATTVPSLVGVTGAANAAFKVQTPTLSGNTSTGLTTSLPTTAAGIGGNINSVWAAIT